MARRPRFIPENKNGVLVEISCRTIGARALLVPSPNPRRFNEVVVGVLGRALEVSPLELCAAVVLGNHAHWLVVVHDQQQLSRFMHHVAGNLSKEIGGRIRQWRGAFWERRYDGIVVSDEPEKQWSRLKYVLRNSVKEGLVESPMDWPGVHCARALVHGESLEGYWFNRSKECAARHRGLTYGTYDFATCYRVHFAQLPAFRDLAPEEYQNRVAALVREIEEEGERERAGNSVAGVEKILNQNPYEQPTRKAKRSTRPLFHAEEPQVRKSLREELRAFLARYWSATERLADRRSSLIRDLLQDFPPGCYPPALPFLGDPPPMRPPLPPSRRLEIVGSDVIGRGDIPVVEVPRARGQPP